MRFTEDSSNTLNFYQPTNFQAQTVVNIGDVGIGTASPASSLQVNSNENTNTSVVFLENTGLANAGNLRVGIPAGNGNYASGATLNDIVLRNEKNGGSIIIGAQDSVQIGVSGSDNDTRMIVNSSGDVGIGITSPAKTMHIFQTEGGVGAKHATIRLGGFSTVGPDIAAYRHTGNSNDQGLVFSTYHNSNGTTDTMTLDSLGDVKIEESLGIGVAASSTTGRLDCSNDVVAFSTSDKRLKENIKPLENSLDKVLKISGVEFDWKELTEEEKETIHGNEGHDIGVIAQEVEEILPQVVTTRDTGYKAVKYEKIVPLLIESVKELKREVDEIKQKCDCLNK